MKGFDNYKISDTGLVKSIQRKILRINNHGTIHQKTINERILKPAIAGSGYYFVCLRRNNRHHNCRIHRLVAQTFLGNIPSGLVVCHKDHNKLNNHFSNLEFGTMAKNAQDYYKSIGKRSGFVPVNDVPKIIGLISKGDKIINIANEYGVTRNDIAVLNKIIALTGQELE